MFNSVFKGIFDSELTTVISITDFLICLGISILLGLALAFTYTYKTRYTRSFLITLALLPAVVCVVIMMVNGNIGTSVAVAGAFSLVRFRSAPGTAREIVAIFLGMSSGLIAGMGYVGFAVLFTLIMCGAFLLYSRIDFGARKKESRCKSLRITIPEDLNYTSVFNEVFEKYTSETSLVKVKTTNMGSMFCLTYDITLKADASEKEFIDELRVRNGNLEIMISQQENQSEAL